MRRGAPARGHCPVAPCLGSVGASTQTAACPAARIQDAFSLHQIKVPCDVGESQGVLLVLAVHRVVLGGQSYGVVSLEFDP